MQIILSHAGADFDAYASMVAAQRLYPEARLVTLGKPAQAVREFLSLHQGQFPVIAAQDIDPGQVSLLVMVDTSNPRRLGPLRMLAEQSGVEVHIYDHHPANAESVKGDLSFIEPLGAAVTVVLRRLPRDLPLSLAEATLFLIAIYEETGNLTYSSTTPEDLKTAAWLLEKGARLPVLRKVLQQPLSQEQNELRQRLMSEARKIAIGNATALLLTATSPTYVEEMAEVIWRLQHQESVDLTLAAVQMGRRTFLIGRSRHPRLNLMPAFRALGGGGHPCACSASLPEMPPQQALQQLLERLDLNQARSELVREHMSERVDRIDVAEVKTVAEAAQHLRSLGRTATVVTQGDQVIGVLARSDLDKALHHGLDQMPAQSVMTHPVLAIDPDAPLEEARKRLIEHNIGRLPVMKDGKLLGIISRTDVLRHLYQVTPLEWEVPVSQQLLQLPGRWLDLLRTAGEMAKQCGVEIYAVGGFVRDLLLHRLNGREWDLDLCVEGTVDELLQGLAEHWQATIHRHPRFETATLLLPDGQKVDVARARQETYVRPAALPEVQSSNLKQDLFRRDFTINALALRLTAGNFGELIDFFGGQADLQGQSIRVLHNHSFIDDPTRILRAIRLEQRLGFRLGDTSEHLLRAAIQQGILPLAGPDRLRDEIILCLSEPNAVAILERLNKLKVLHSLHPELALHPKILRLLHHVTLALQETSSFLKVEHWRVYARAWLSRWQNDSLQALVRHYHFRLPPPSDLGEILWRLNRKELAPSQLRRLLTPLSEEDLVVIWALNQEGKLDRELARQRVRHFVEVLRHQKPLLRGDDILALGLERGPRIAVLKGLSFDLQLDQGWKDREQALAWLQGQIH